MGLGDYLTAKRRAQRKQIKAELRVIGSWYNTQLNLLDGHRETAKQEIIRRVKYGNDGRITTLGFGLNRSDLANTGRDSLKPKGPLEYAKPKVPLPRDHIARALRLERLASSKISFNDKQIAQYEQEVLKSKRDSDEIGAVRLTKEAYMLKVETRQLKIDCANYRRVRARATKEQLELAMSYRFNDETIEEMKKELGIYAEKLPVTLSSERDRELAERLDDNAAELEMEATIESEMATLGENHSREVQQYYEQIIAGGQERLDQMVDMNKRSIDLEQQIEAAEEVRAQG